MYAFVNKYTVEPGDTLSSIARRFELLSATQLLRVNPEIADPDLIYPGQVINVPKVVPMSTYIVRSGDRLWSIVSNYNRKLMRYYGNQITMDEVLAYNPGIKNPDLIYPGMIVYLPEIL
jgi:spore germination protein YaaH